MNLVCIKCPRGCEITIDGDKISGNACVRGLEYAKEEMTNPVRIVTYLAKSGDTVIPVKTDGEVPKSRIFDVVKEISKLNITSGNIGDIVIENVLNLGVNVIITGKKYIKYE